MPLASELAAGKLPCTSFDLFVQARRFRRRLLLFIVFHMEYAMSALIRHGDMIPYPSAVGKPCLRESGFTLIEILIAVAVLGILMAIAIPNFIEMINRTRVGMQAEELMTDLGLARSEAATRSLRATVCVSTDGASCVSSATAWQAGRLVFVDSNADGAVSVGETILKYEQALRGDTTIAATGFSSAIGLTYGPYGGLVPATSGSFKICSAASAVGRQIAVAVTGRATSSRVACP